MAGKFELLTLIGTGTFGEAWIAKSVADGRKCVVKVIKILKLSEKELDQSLTEVSILARMNHPNIIQYLDAYVDDGSLNIAMEYAAGGDLHKKISNQKGIHFGREVVLDWFVQICLVLQYIHGQNILHRDLKSQNIFLTSQNMVKVGDFGIARVLRDSADHAQTTIGTPFYLSPEICQKKPYNHKSDMWALGCVLYEMCCLHVPFDAPDFQGLVQKILQEKYDPIPRHLGSTLGFIVTKLLDKDPDRRPSASAVLGMSSLKVYVQRNQNRSRSGLTQRQKSESRTSVKEQKVVTKKGSVDRDGAKQDKKRFQNIDKENIDPKEVGRTYIIKNPKFRHLSMATPKISKVVARQKQSHSSESDQMIKDGKKIPRTSLYSKPQRTISEPRPQRGDGNSVKGDLKQDHKIPTSKLSNRPRVVSEPQSMRNKQNIDVLIQKQSKKISNGDLEAKKPPTGRRSLEPNTTNEKENRRHSSCGTEVRMENGEIDKISKRRSLEPKHSKEKRKSGIPRRKSLEPRPQPVGSENEITLVKSTEKQDSGGSFHIYNDCINISSDNEEVFYPAEQVLSLWLEPNESENCKPEGIPNIYIDQQDGQSRNNANKLNAGKKGKFQFGPQRKEIERVLRRSSSYDTVVMTKQKEKPNEVQIQRAFSTGNIEDCQKANDSATKRDKIISTTYSVYNPVMPVKNVCINCEENDEKRNATGPAPARGGGEIYGTSDFISRTVYNSMMETDNKPFSAIEYIEGNLLHVFTSENLEQTSNAIQNNMKKHVGFHKVKELLTDTEQNYLPLILYYISLQMY